MDSIKSQLYTIIFGTDTKWGKRFDLILLWVIVASVLAVMLESVRAIKIEHGMLLRIIEWVFTVLFTIEFIVRLWVVNSKKKYIFSFYGMIDLLSLLPSYLGIFFGGAHSLMVIRTLRLLRIFRILKLARFLGEAAQLKEALLASRHKIIVFLVAVIALATISGTAMYWVEGYDNGFTSIPKSIYWAIVTLTTVGYGDIAPQSVFGQFLAAFIMIMGYGVIAVPTGIVTAELTRSANKEHVIECSNCNITDHKNNAKFCHKCGELLPIPENIL
ncbi:MAG: voltage-gated potassium channel [Sphingobacteriales bacterium]|jgi:voltage-gated potassium channel